MLKLDFFNKNILFKNTKTKYNINVRKPQVVFLKKKIKSLYFLNKNDARELIIIKKHTPKRKYFQCRNFTFMNILNKYNKIDAPTLFKKMFYFYFYKKFLKKKKTTLL